ncbi:MAG: helix-turn-helix domain-containing protein [Butyricicoccaceae bacterium]
MNCAKVGQLIAQLRREKGMTQQNLADALNISNKTVSKWECGAGCPDVSLLAQLSAVLGADIERVLEGRITPNRPDIGRMERVRFYVCPSCGNILTSTGAASVSCCGRKLEPLVPEPGDGEHTITVEHMDLDHYIAFDHAMSKEHYISFAAYVNYERVMICRLYPEQSAEVRIPIMQGRGDLYLYCVRHGLKKYPRVL